VYVYCTACFLVILTYLLTYLLSYLLTCLLSDSRRRCTELPCEITTPLVDIETQMNETVSLVLVISKRRQVTWSKNGQEVVSSDRFQVSVSEDGLRHVLTLKDVTKDEMAQFTASIDDFGHGTITSNCQVTVVGTSLITSF